MSDQHQNYYTGRASCQDHRGDIIFHLRPTWKKPPHPKFLKIQSCQIIMKLGLWGGQDVLRDILLLWCWSDNIFVYGSAPPKIQPCQINTKF